MKKLVNFGNDIIRSLNVFDFALIKVCLISLGVFFGTLWKQDKKKVVSAVSLIIFVVTYIALIPKMINRIGKSFR